MEDFMQRVVLCAAIASAWVAEGAIAPSHIRLQPPFLERGVAPASPVEGPKSVRWHGRHGRARMQTGRDGPVTRDDAVADDGKAPLIGAGKLNEAIKKGCERAVRR